MTVNVMPSKFDICLLSGVIFNFACVTANYWPPPSHTTPISPYGPSGSNNGMRPVYGEPIRTYGPYSPSSSPYYPPNYSYSSVSGNSRLDPYPPRGGDPYFPNRYSGQPSPSSGYGYQYNGMSSAVPYGSSQGSGYGSGYRYPSSPSSPSSPSTASPFDYRPQSTNAYPVPNQLPYQYWRSPPTSPYDTFDRRGSGYGSGGGPMPGPPVPQSGYYPPMNPYSSPMSYGQPAYPNSLYGHGEYYGPRTAYARLKSNESRVEGEVRFVQQDNRFVSVTGRILGLVPGAHGLHVHEGVDKQGSCDNIGLHFNPMNTEHGGKSEWKRHVGDLGNVWADQDGVAYFSIIDSLISLMGPNSVLNRTLAITEFGDDLGKGVDQSKVNGNAGKPLSCGPITLTL